MEKRRRRDAIAQAYDAVGVAGSRAPAGMGFPTGAALARELGYPEASVDAAPPALLDAFVGASALAPRVLAEGRPGELVLDLGCGAGLDAWLLARAGYRVAALDASAAMLSRLAGLGASMPQGLVTVRAELPDLPLRNGTADWVLLNGVSNLIKDRQALWREVCRVLAPGGRVLAADLVALGPVPDDLRELPEAWAWCLGGAPEASRWVGELAGAGLDAPKVSILEEFPPFARAVAEARRPG